MKEIKLTKGYVTQVDDEDFEMLSKYRWHAQVAVHLVYASNSQKVLMHRLIMEPPPDLVIDHIDGDGLNNQRANLRICTHKQNMWNRRRRSSQVKSKYPNVRKTPFLHPYSVQLTHDGQSHYLRGFSKEEQAHEAALALKARLRGKFSETLGESNPRICQFCGKTRGADVLMSTDQGTICLRCKLLKDFPFEYTKNEDALVCARLRLFDLQDEVRKAEEDGVGPFIRSVHASNIARLRERIERLIPLVEEEQRHPEQRVLIHRELREYVERTRDLKPGDPSPYAKVPVQVETGPAQAWLDALERNVGDSRR